MSDRKLPRDFYNSTKGIFITDIIRDAFGRRRAFLMQFLLNEYEKAIKENKLVKGYVFIPNDLFFRGTTYNCNSSETKHAFKYFTEFQKSNFLSIESFGVQDGFFYKFDLHNLFIECVPKLIEDLKIARNNHQGKKERINHGNKNQ